MKPFTNRLKPRGVVKYGSSPYRVYRLKRKQESAIDVVFMTVKDYNTHYKNNLEGYDYIINVYGFPIGVNKIAGMYTVIEGPGDTEVFMDIVNAADAMVDAIKYTYYRAVEELYLNKLKPAKGPAIGTRVSYSISRIGGGIKTTRGTICEGPGPVLNKYRVELDDNTTRYLAAHEFELL